MTSLCIFTDRIDEGCYGFMILVILGVRGTGAEDETSFFI